MGLTCTVLSLKPKGVIAPLELQRPRGGPLDYLGTVTGIFEMHSYFHPLLVEISEEVRRNDGNITRSKSKDPFVWMIYGKEDVFEGNGFNKKEDVLEICRKISSHGKFEFINKYFNEGMEILKSFYCRAASNGEVVFCFVD